MNIIFGIDGGLGKSIMATVIVEAIKKKYKKSNLIVVTGYPDVFLHNPYVNRCLKGDNGNRLYKEYIKDQKCKIFVANPYHTDDFLQNKKHLFYIWCELYGLKYNNEVPQIFLTQSEIDYYKSVYKVDKPIFAIQTHGGGGEQAQRYNWARDLPNSTIENIINQFKDEYTICHIKRKDQPTFANTLQALDGFRSIAVLLAISTKRLFIDSFAQHLSSALNLPAVVCWVTTSPHCFGYELHKNIISNQFNINPLYEHPNYQPFLLTEDIKTMPYKNLDDVYDDETIIKNILSL
jgi:ADP-heptose:LPS heptosyltransferase